MVRDYLQEFFKEKGLSKVELFDIQSDGKFQQSVSAETVILFIESLSVPLQNKIIIHLASVQDKDGRDIKNFLDYILKGLVDEN